MAETKPIPVRLDDGLISRLDTAGSRMGTNRAALIRYLTQSFLDYFEKNGGIVSLPPNWQEIMRGLDGRKFGQDTRRARSSRKSPAKAKRAHMRDIDTVSCAVFGTIPAGGPQSSDGASYPVRHVPVRRGRFPDGFFGLDVSGNSMNAARPEPVLDGETVILLPPELREPQHNDIVAALCDGQSTLKRLICLPGKPCTLHAESTDPAFTHDIVPAHDLVIQGVMIGKL